MLLWRKAACVAVSFALVAASAPLNPGVAHAEELAVSDVATAEGQQVVDSAQSSLDEAESRMQSITSDFETLTREVAELQKRIDDMAAQAMESQKAVFEGRATLGKMASFEYRSGSAESLLLMLLESKDFNDLMLNFTYLASIMQYQSDEIAAQKERSERFDKLVDDLNFQKNEQEKKLADIEAKKAEAAKVVADASSKLQDAQDDQASRIAALKKKAEEMASQGAVSEPVKDENANTVDRPDVVPPGPAEPNPDPNPPAPNPAPDPTPNPTPDPGISWSTGVASAYGGSTDPYTPNPGITATGAVCDDNSMGVAVPMAWPRYWQYYGRTVEISYNGMTVFATVNDCGYMGAGSRSLDLQPGVWKAFGFSSCNDWGLRTVSYRFL